MSNPIFEQNIADEPPDYLYRFSQLVTEGIPGLDAVTDAHVQRFHEQGFLVVYDAFTPQEVQDGLDGLVNVIVNEEVAAGKVSIDIEAKARDIFYELSDESRQDAVRKLMWFTQVEPRLKTMAEKPALLDVLQRLIGEPPQLFQDMALMKPPHIGREKPWHQDFAYFNMPLNTSVVGVWIAMDEALVENGCMFLIPGTHKSGPVVHFQRRDWQICDTDVHVAESLAIPLKPGSCLLFDGLLHHGTPPSHSDKRRRAVQFHYRPASTIPYPDSTQRLATFGEEGKDVSC
ncbi:MAG: phytanoyl-CoA dioxygenase family protein [Anaerolineae bacterium]|nr:phytanoyl-CoA dioxygenase family protein [Anaerolineae bacterium]